MNILRVVVLIEIFKSERSLTLDGFNFGGEKPGLIERRFNPGTFQENQQFGPVVLTNKSPEEPDIVFCDLFCQQNEGFLI